MNKLTGAAAAILWGSTLAMAQDVPPAEKAGKPIDVVAPATPSEATSIRFGSPKAIDKPAGALRVAVYNVENLFDDKDDPALSGRYEDSGNVKPIEQRRGVAAAIHAINADVLGLTEVESKEALLWFRDEFLKDMGYEHVASIDAGDERGIEQSVLSRYPIKDVKNWPKLSLGGTHPEKWGRDANDNAGQPITFHRSPLAVTIEVPPEAASKYVAPDGSKVAAGKPYQFTFIVVHQKSGGPGSYWREREAAKTLELIGEMQKAEPTRNIVLAGDFNAKPEDRAMKIYFDGGMVDLFAHRKRGDSTYITHESGRPIDFILMNAAAAKELIPETRFILGTPARPAGVDYRTTPGPQGYGSDHYPLVMDLVPADR